MSSARRNASRKRTRRRLHQVFCSLISLVATGCAASHAEHQPSHELPTAERRLTVALPDARDLFRSASDAPETHGTFGPGTIHRVKAVLGGVKDDVTFFSKPHRERIFYKVAIGGNDGVVAVRQLDRRPIVEWLGEDGAPRFRTVVPGIFALRNDTSGEGHAPDWAARVEIEGCDVDRDPRPALRREFVRARASSCVLSVDWTGIGVGYPAVLDPVWTVANDMVAPRQSHRAIKLDDGNVIVVGGQYAGVTTEIFDVATRAWSLTGNLNTARFEHGAARLDDGRVLVAGGQGITMLDTCELYDPMTGMWSMAASLGVARRGATLTSLPGGDVVLTGGNTSNDSPSASAEKYSAQSGQWTSVSDMMYARRNHAAVVRDGKLLVIGGARSDTVVTSTVEELDPASGNWTLAAPLIQKRSYMGAAVRWDGAVVVAGGETGLVSTPYTTSTEILAPGAVAWQSGPSLSVARRGLSLLALEGGGARDRLIAIGGFEGASVSNVAEGWLRDEVKWDSLPNMTYRHYFHDATVLDGGGVLVTGGTFSETTAEVFFPESQGSSCLQDAECSSGYCTDGVCCEERCFDSCARCDSAGQRGRCVPSAASAPAAVGHPACAATTDACAGRCDGLSTACVYPGANTPCGEVSCEANAALFPACRGDGSCGPPIRQDCRPFVCSEVGCAMSCAETGLCADGFSCDITTGECVEDAPSCSSDGRFSVRGAASEDCSPYRCDATGICPGTCSGTGDCWTGFRCAASSTCEPIRRAAEDSACSCRLAGDRHRNNLPDGSFARAIILSATLCLARRRRGTSLGSMRT